MPGCVESYLYEPGHNWLQRLAYMNSDPIGGLPLNFGHQSVAESTEDSIDQNKAY